MTTARKKIAAAHKQPCAHCPWRLSNQGKPHPHGFYDRSNLRRLWDGIRQGERMTCHPTDPDMAEFEGYEGTADRHITHECAGSLILVGRELERFQDCARAAEAEGANDGLKRYQRFGRKRLNREGLAAWAFAAVGLAWPGQPPFQRNVNLNEPDVGHVDLVAWEPRHERASR